MGGWRQTLKHEDIVTFPLVLVPALWATVLVTNYNSTWLTGEDLLPTSGPLAQL